MTIEDMIFSGYISNFFFVSGSDKEDLMYLWYENAPMIEDPNDCPVVVFGSTKGGRNMVIPLRTKVDILSKDEFQFTYQGNVYKVKNA